MPNVRVDQLTKGDVFVWTGRPVTVTEITEAVTPENEKPGRWITTAESPDTRTHFLDDEEVAIP